jgi:hypothetical protein
MAATSGGKEAVFRNTQTECFCCAGYFEATFGRRCACTRASFPRCRRTEEDAGLRKSPMLIRLAISVLFSAERLAGCTDRSTSTSSLMANPSNPPPQI